MSTENKSERPQLRPATTADLDAIAAILSADAASYSEPDYRYPYRTHYPEDYLKWGMKRIEGFLDQPEKYAVLVVVSESHPVPFAYAVWDIAATTPSKDASDDGIDERRDANPARLREFRRVLAAASKAYFGRYAEQHLYLAFIATHPDFRRRGAASLLCRWGMDRAAASGWPVTLFATALGKKTYDSLGFATLGTETIQVEGEEDKFYSVCMEWRASQVNGKTG
ncbi:acyl-CoA N-acyltransferase [Mycena galopus ATCC 62051]|nr:acyl-CoA N-acyltransferase [Mycena galopus ATCC 62051]